LIKFVMQGTQAISQKVSFQIITQRFIVVA